MEKVSLERYEITGRLGSGADYDVRAATDLETGAEVALKRPRAPGREPKAARRNRGSHRAAASGLRPGWRRRRSPGPSAGLHRDRRSRTTTSATTWAKPYTVFVQGRAPGIPLLGDMMSRITGVPVGAGQNLFTLFPLEQATYDPRFPIHNQLLELEQAYLDAGYILMDMRPQNIFFRPGSGQIQVIDTGALAGVDDPAPRGRPSVGRERRLPGTAQVLHDSGVSPSGTPRDIGTPGAYAPS